MAKKKSSPRKAVKIHITKVVWRVVYGANDPDPALSQSSYLVIAPDAESALSLAMEVAADDGLLDPQVNCIVRLGCLAAECGQPL